MTTSYSVNPRWFSPELLTESGPVSTHSDVWSFGMLCLEILSGDVPFADIKRDIAVLREIDNGVLPKHPGRVAISQGLSDAIWKVLQKCWGREPSTRPSITEVKNSLLGKVPSPSAGKLKIKCRRTKVNCPARLEPRSPTRQWPTFSLGRSGNRASTSKISTSSDPFSLSPQKSRPTTAPGSSSGIPENGELSPIGIPAIGFGMNALNSRHRQNSKASLNSSYSNEFDNPISPQRLPPNPAYSIDFDQSSISPQPLHPRSASLSGAPTLSVPHLSTSLPARPGLYIPAERSVSLPPRSVLSSDSSAHLSGPVRDAVTDPRIIVNVNGTGVVQSGTLEGLVERLVVNFSGCCYWPPPQKLNLTYMSRPTTRYRVQRCPPHGLRGLYDSRRLLRDAFSSFLRCRVESGAASRR